MRQTKLAYWWVECQHCPREEVRLYRYMASQGVAGMVMGTRGTYRSCMLYCTYSTYIDARDSLSLFIFP